MNEHENAAAYALDALDEDERRTFERHLRDCTDCRREVDELREAASALALAADPVEPPPELRGWVLAEARRGGDVVALPSRRLLPVLATVASVAAVACAVWAVTSSRSLDDERAARAEERAALAIAADPDARRVALRNGAVYVSPSGRAALVTTLPKPPGGKTYEAWVFEGKTPRPAGTFDGGAVVLSRGVAPGQAVAVTVEPAGGVDAPTGPRVA